MKKKLIALIIAGVFLITQCITAYGIETTSEESTNNSTSSVSNNATATGISSGYTTDRYIVKYKENNGDKGQRGRNNLKKKLEDKIKKSKKVRSKKNYDQITLKAKEKPDDFINQMMKDNEDIEYIQPDYEMSLSSNDANFTSQWGVNNGQSVSDAVYGEKHIDANVVPAWEISRGEGITVAVIDTGVDISHEDLSGNVWTNAKEIAGNRIDDDGNGYIDDVNGWNFFDDNNIVYNQLSVNEDEHGTHVSGIIAATKDNAKGIAGVAPKAKIMTLKVFKNGAAYTSDIIEAIEYAESNGAKVVNCSWGTSKDNPALKETIQQSKMLFVCAVGNSAANIDTSPVYPASYNLSNVISVASIDKSGKLASSSNYGGNLASIAAPGDDIYSTLPANKYGSRSGTSMAAAFVSGEAALIVSKYGNITAQEIKQKIMSSSDKLSTLVGKVNRGNKINVNSALLGLSSEQVINVGESEGQQNGSQDGDGYSTFYSAPQTTTGNVFSVPSGAVNGQLNMTLSGNTYTNLLGTDGDCEDITKWQVPSPSGIALDNTNKVNGSNSFKFTVQSSGNAHANKNVLPLLNTSKYYLVSGYIMNGSATSGAAIFAYSNGTGNTPTRTSYVTLSQGFTRVCCKIAPSDFGTGSTNFLIQPTGYGSSGQYFNVDSLMINEISSSDYTLSNDELMTKYPYISGTKCVNAMRIRSIGKNLVPGYLSFSTNKEQFQSDGINSIKYTSNGTPVAAQTNNKIKVLPNTRYIFSCKKSDITVGGRLHVVFYDKSGNKLTGLDENGIIQFTANNTTTKITVDTPASADYATIRAVIDNADNRSYDSGLSTRLYEIQLEKGESITLYEPYKESSMYLPNNVSLNSVGDVKDEINIYSCNYIAKTKRLKFNGSENWVYYGDGGTNAYAFALKIDDFSKESYIQNAILMIQNPITYKVVWINDQSLHFYTESGQIVIIVPKVLIDNYTGVNPSDKLREYISDNKGEITYKLVTPLSTNLNIPSITCYAGGTIYLENAIRDTVSYGNGITIANTNLPIKSIESMYKIDGSTMTPIDLSKVSIASNGLSLTIAGANNGEQYQYTYLYDSSLSTVPSVQFIVPTSTDDQTNDNTSMINQLKEVINNLSARVTKLEQQGGGSGSARINAGPFKINCTSGSSINLVLTASNSKDFSTRNFTVIYNAAELDIVDLCAETATMETGVCNVAGTNIVITKVAPGVIEFFINNPVKQGTTYTGTANTIVFKSKINGQATVSYTVQ